MKINKIAVLTLGVITPAMAFAADPSWVSSILNIIPDSTAGWVATAGVAVEFLLRMVKTDKPKSIAYLVSDSLHGLGKIADKAGQLLDKILPQRLS